MNIFEEFSPSGPKAKVRKKECHVHLVLDKDLFNAIEAETKRLGISRNSYCSQILAYYLEQQGKYQKI